METVEMADCLVDFPKGAAQLWTDIMEWQFPMPMTIRCFKCGNVHEVTFTSEERHEFPCPACGEVDVYDLGAMKEKVAAAYAKKARKSGEGR